MKKKFVIGSIMILALILILIGYGYCNLKSNSVYYSKNTPHKEGTEPVLMMLVDNLDWIYNPDIEGIEYDFDGKATIKMYNDNKKQIGFITSSYKYGKKGYLFDDIKSETMVEFDSGFKAIKMYNTSKKVQKIAFTKIEEKKYKDTLYSMLKQVIDKQTKPLINLQWIFDIVYRDKFN
ncbi:hypothetical protein SAMN02910327_01267 [Peptostreptococcaceae bacterium pGA-8]|nr:hypothetical protein SAMN02910327_01267 [Peptostreptococcaceae bacterium pGA-8]